MYSLSWVCNWTDSVRSRSEAQELVHTPSSLFAGLRQSLQARGLVCHVQGPDDLLQVEPGDFIEFKATLRRSSPVEFLEALEKVATMMTVFDTPANKPANNARDGGGGNKQNRQSRKNQNRMIQEQIRALLTALTDNEGKVQDLVAELPGLRAVLAIEQDYFSNPSMNDIIGGTFHVFGKAANVIPEKGDGYINLLRKTAFGKFEKLEEFFDIMEGGLDTPDSPRRQLGFTGSLSPRIEGPALLVIPVAIFA